ncbi:caspase-1-A-like [Rhinophrynus dorsalis]
MADQLFKMRKGLIKGCNIALIKDLCDDLLDEDILSPGEVEMICAENTCDNKCRKLVDFVRKKGVKSSSFLLQKVQERDPTLAKDLGITEPMNLSVPVQEQPNDNHNISEPTQEQNENTHKISAVGGITLCTEKELNDIKKKEGSMLYDINPSDKRKRLALIICNKKFKYHREREGAQVDQYEMSKLLEGLGYDVQSKSNMKAEEMKKTMEEFAAREEHADSDSTFIVLMSHGVRNGICGVESQGIKKPNGQIEKMTDLLQIDDIFNTFNNVNCSKLRGKPKIIIIQACRGNENSAVLVSDSVPETPDSLLEDDSLNKILKETDFACFCSTTPDTVSWRHPQSGSLFIQSLIKKMREHAHCDHLEEIFIKVKNDFKDGTKQMPTSDRVTLTKKFYLFPGY